MTKKITFWPAISLLLLGWCIFLWFTKGCNHPAPTTADNGTNARVARLIADSTASDATKKNLFLSLTWMTAKKQHGDTLLKEADKKISYLINQRTVPLAYHVIYAKTIHDTADYITSCDSLAAETKKSKSQFDIYKRNVQSSIENRDKIIANRQQLISALSSEANGYKAAVVLLQKENKRVEAANQPRNKVYLGIDAQFSTINLFQSAGLGVMLQNKKEDIYRISAGIMRQPVIPVPQFPGYVEIGAYRKLSFHR